MDDPLLRLRGLSREDVERKIADGFASGHYRPSRPGIAYMLSPATYMTGKDGKLSRSVSPHIIFYAPYLTDADPAESLERALSSIASEPTA
jgi:hypothetical protein